MRVLRIGPRYHQSLPDGKPVGSTSVASVSATKWCIQNRPCSAISRVPPGTIAILGGGGGQPGSESTPGITAGASTPVLRAFGHDPPDATSRIWNIALAAGDDVNVSVDYGLVGPGAVIKADVEAIRDEVS